MSSQLDDKIKSIKKFATAKDSWEGTLNAPAMWFAPIHLWYLAAVATTLNNRSFNVIQCEKERKNLLKIFLLRSDFALYGQSNDSVNYENILLFRKELRALASDHTKIWAKITEKMRDVSETWLRPYLNRHKSNTVINVPSDLIDYGLSFVCVCACECKQFQTKTQSPHFIIEFDSDCEGKYKKVLMNTWTFRSNSSFKMRNAVLCS